MGGWQDNFFLLCGGLLLGGCPEGEATEREVGRITVHGEHPLSSSTDRRVGNQWVVVMNGGPGVNYASDGIIDSIDLVGLLVPCIKL